MARGVFWFIAALFNSWLSGIAVGYLVMNKFGSILLPTGFEEGSGVRALYPFG